ncbi:hypothetical protein ABZ345_38755 [Lentzea sp. NPDC005914]|uniref:hypothetical protein n=1 Tax=Lentzea sp. NPDC005914 TaxID=3154572 RepID=UPI0033EF54F4
MSPKKNDPVAPPTIGEEWHVRYGVTDAVGGWQELENRAANNLRAAWETMRHRPGAGNPTGRHHPLGGRLATAVRSGRVMPRWQIEVTGGDRLWYLLDVEKRAVWVDYAGAHPKVTE